MPVIHVNSANEMNESFRLPVPVWEIDDESAKWEHFTGVLRPKDQTKFSEGETFPG